MSQHQSADALADGIRKTKRLAAEGDVNGLLLMLKSPIEENGMSLRASAAARLGELRDPASVQPLMDALHDESEMVRALAARALGEIGDKKATEALVEALADPSLAVKSHAAKSLGALRDHRSIGPLIKLLWDNDWWVRKAGAEALVEIGSEEAREHVRALAERESWRRRRAIKGALRRL